MESDAGATACLECRDPRPRIIEEEMWDPEQESSAIWGREYIRGAMFGAVACLILGVIFLIAGFAVQADERILAARGVHVPGTIVGKRSRLDEDADGKDRRMEYYLSVHYLSSAPSKEFKVNQFAYNLASSSKIQVVYDPQDPQRARLEGRIASQSSMDLFPIGGLLLVGSLAFTIWFIKLKKDAREEAPDLIDALASARKSRRG
jgi:hypothetical protein